MKLNEIKYFYPEKPTLSMIEMIDEFSNDPNFICEPKFNGQRCLVHMLDGEVDFWDRHGKHLKYNDDPNHYAERQKIIQVLVDIFGKKGYYVFDSELRHNKVTNIQNKLVIYDIHVYKNEILLNTFAERRKILEAYFGNYDYDESRTVHLINQYKENFQKVFEDYTGGEHGNPDEFEGIVMKNLDGILKLSRTSGVDSRWMFKIRKKTGRHRW